MVHLIEPLHSCFGADQNRDTPFGLAPKPLPGPIDGLIDTPGARLRCNMLKGKCCLWLFVSLFWKTEP